MADHVHLIVYPQGDARPVILFDHLVDLMTVDQLLYLNGKIASKLLEIANQPTGEENGLEDPETNS